MRSARPARPRSRVATPSDTPQRFQDFTKDFKISPKISRRFQDFTQDFKISQRFQDFKEDFKISVEISAVVYEISASGGPLGRDMAVIDMITELCNNHMTILHSSAKTAARDDCTVMSDLRRLGAHGTPVNRAWRRGYA